MLYVSTSKQLYGCSDGTTTGYMKVETSRILGDFMQYVKRSPITVTV